MSEFGTINIEEMQKEHERVNSEGGNNFLDQFVPMPDPPAGKTASLVVRLLPPAKGGKLFQYTRYHKINGRKVHCPRPLTADGKWDKKVPNPIADYYSALWRKADKVKAEDGENEVYKELVAEARDIKPVERYYYNAVVRELVVNGEKQKNVGPRILSVGKTLHSKILIALFGDETEKKLGNVTDLKNGFDFVIRVTKDGEFPKYDRSSFDRDPTPAGKPEEIAEWAKNLHDLSKFRIILPLERLEKELAIHRHLIEDDAEGFNVDDFDSKYASAHNLGGDELGEMPSSGANVSVNVSVNDEPEEPVVDDADLDIENKDFFAELEEFKQG